MLFSLEKSSHASWRLDHTFTSKYLRNMGLSNCKFKNNSIYSILHICVILFILYYSQKWEKSDVRWHGNGTMSYRTKKSFDFQPHLSVGDHSMDTITTLNVPVLTGYYQKRDGGWFEKYAAEFAFTNL